MDNKKSSTGLIRYDAMCQAVAECERVDEAKDLRDKAKAIEVYARQAKNYDVERQAGAVRLRAERRAGDLLKKSKRSGQRQKAGDNSGAHRGKKRSSRAASTLRDLGVSYDQSHKWQKLAEVPEEEFEAILAEPGLMPTTEGILNRSKPPVTESKMHLDPNALWVLGALDDMIRKGVVSLDAHALYQKMQDFQRERLNVILPKIIDWLKELK